MKLMDGTIYCKYLSLLFWFLLWHRFSIGIETFWAGVVPKSVILVSMTMLSCHVTQK